MSGPRVTACICTHNRPDYVATCLAGLVAQTCSPDRFAILVVDSAGSEASAARLRSMVAAVPNARLVRLEDPGISAARNAGARQCGSYIAYIDDDAIADPSWIDSIEAVVDQAIARTGQPPAVIGGRVLPIWEQPLPAWWPSSLRGVLSIIEHVGEGEFRSSSLPATLEPYGVNMIVHVPALLAAGGFAEDLGRVGDRLLSDEDVELAWRLQDRGLSARYDSRVLVHHQIQAARMNVPWLLRRMALQGLSTAMTRARLGRRSSVWRAAPRRALVATLTWPAQWLVSQDGSRLIGARWRHAYAIGFLRGVREARRIRLALARVS